MFTKCPHLSPKLYHKSFLRHRSLSLTKTLEKRRFHQNDPPLPAFEQTQPRYISKYSIVLASHFRSLILQITHVHPNLPNTKHVQWTCFFLSPHACLEPSGSKKMKSRERQTAQDAIWAICLTAPSNMSTENPHAKYRKKRNKGS